MKSNQYQQTQNSIIITSKIKFILLLNTTVTNHMWEPATTGWVTHLVIYQCSELWVGFISEPLHSSVWLLHAGPHAAVSHLCVRVLIWTPLVNFVRNFVLINKADGPNNPPTEAWAKMQCQGNVSNAGVWKNSMITTTFFSINLIHLAPGCHFNWLKCEDFCCPLQISWYSWYITFFVIWCFFVLVPFKIWSRITQIAGHIESKCWQSIS